MPLSTDKIQGHRVLCKDALPFFLTNDTATRVAHCQVRVNVLMSWQPIAFVGVVDMDISPVINRSYGCDGVHD